MKLNRVNVVSPLGTIKSNRMKTGYDLVRMDKRLHMKNGLQSNSNGKILDSQYSRNFELTKQTHSNSFRGESMLNRSQDIKIKNVTAENIRMDDLTAIRKNIQCNLRPDLNAIAAIKKPMSLRKQSLGGQTLLQQAIDIHTLKSLNNNSVQGYTSKRI